MANPDCAIGYYWNGNNCVNIFGFWQIVAIVLGIGLVLAIIVLMIYLIRTQKNGDENK